MTESAALFLFGSVAVSAGHPDKLCDQVADAILDALLREDKDAVVKCSACTKTGMVMALGEVITKGIVDYEQVIRDAVKTIGYDSEDKGLDGNTMNVIVAIEERTPDLAQVISASLNLPSQPTTGSEAFNDQGVFSGYATDETPEMMPMSQALASALCNQYDKARREGKLPWARPGARTEVVLEYKHRTDGSLLPSRVKLVSLCAQSIPGADVERVEADLRQYVVELAVPQNLCDDETLYHLKEPKASTQSDTGLSGRRFATDCYGGWVSALSVLSGQDMTQLERCASYGARWAAKSLVAARLCRRCQVQLSYFPGVATPVAVQVNSFRSVVQGKTDADLAALLSDRFDFRCGSLCRTLLPEKVQFQRLSAQGHFGRNDIELPWEIPKALSFAS